MTDFITWRQRYAKVFVVCYMCISLFIMFQGIKGGIAQFDTNLPSREPLIALFIRLRLKLGDRVFPQALVGKDGWLEYTGAGNLDFFQNNVTMPANSIEDIQYRIQMLYEKLQERNITLIVVIVPNKATIYPDKLPDEIQKISEKSELDMLVSYMQQHGPPVLVDLRQALLEARQERDVYFKTDTHWNSYGSFVAYREIMKVLSQTYPELKPKKSNSFKLQTVVASVHDIPRLMGATHILEDNYIREAKEDDLRWIVYSEEIMPRTVSLSPHSDLPKLLMYLDSFGQPLIPLLAPHFSKATFIQNLSSYPDTLTFKEIDATEPDIVILEFVERYQYSLNIFLANFGIASEERIQ